MKVVFWEGEKEKKLIFFILFKNKKEPELTPEWCCLRAFVLIPASRAVTYVVIVQL